jgi:hypothetical protein
MGDTQFERPLWLAPEATDHVAVAVADNDHVNVGVNVNVNDHVNEK